MDDRYVRLCDLWAEISNKHVRLLNNKVINMWDYITTVLGSVRI
jgi:hypothetical protein